MPVSIHRKNFLAGLTEANGFMRMDLKKQTLMFTYQFITGGKMNHSPENAQLSFAGRLLSIYQLT